MSTVITHSEGDITPEVVDGFTKSFEAQTRVHRILGRPDPDITLRPAALGTGTLTLVFSRGMDAREARDYLVQPQVFTIYDPDVPEVWMQFVVADGEVVMSLDETTRRAWTVEVPFVEVLPE